MRDLPERKQPRLKNCSYDFQGAYFATFCVKDRRRILSRIVFDGEKAVVRLLPCGVVLDALIKSYESEHPGIFFRRYVIMPDHVHLLVGINLNDYPGKKPSLNEIVRSLKTRTTIKIGKAIWQASYYDHIIRNEDEWHDVARYIENNPINWYLGKTPKDDLPECARKYQIELPKTR